MHTLFGDVGSFLASAPVSPSTLHLSLANDFHSTTGTTIFPNAAVQPEWYNKEWKSMVSSSTNPSCSSKPVSEASKAEAFLMRNTAWVWHGFALMTQVNHANSNPWLHLLTNGQRLHAEHMLEVANVAEQLKRDGVSSFHTVCPLWYWDRRFMCNPLTLNNENLILSMVSRLPATTQAHWYQRRGLHALFWRCYSCAVGVNQERFKLLLAIVVTAIERGNELPLGLELYVQRSLCLNSPYSNVRELLQCLAAMNLVAWYFVDLGIIEQTGQKSRLRLELHQHSASEWFEVMPLHLQAALYGLANFGPTLGASATPEETKWEYEMYCKRHTMLPQEILACYAEKRGVGSGEK